MRERGEANGARSAKSVDWRSEVEQRLHAAQLDGATEREIADELAQHLEDRYAELIASGTPEVDARAQVLMELDGQDALAARIRKAIRGRPEPIAIGSPDTTPVGSGSSARDTGRASLARLVSDWLGDLKVGARTLARSPIYALVVILVIALGVGANTVIFTALNAVLLRPPSGVAEPDRLVSVFTSDYSGPIYGGSSYPDYEAIRDDTDAFESVAAYQLQQLTLAADNWTSRGLVEIVSPNYFDVLGVQPAAGRFFGAEEEPGGQPSSAVVISDWIWEKNFGRSQAAIGSTVRVAGKPFTVIGVAPREFSGSLRGTKMQAWLPVSAPVETTGLDPTARGDRGLGVMARLPAGGTIESVQTRLDVIAARLFQAYPAMWTDVNERSRVLTVVPEFETRVPRQSRAVILGAASGMMAAVILVLLIACTNVANLMLSRATVRRAEMGIRLAMGASRGRVVRHLLAESVILAALGGLVGTVVALFLTKVLQSGVPWVRLPIAINFDIPFDLRVLTFSLLVTALTGAFFGLLPALQTTRSLTPMIKEDANARSRLRLRHGLVVFQLASSLVLLVGGGLFLRSVLAANGMDTGFDTEDVIVTRFDLGPEGLSEEQILAFNDQVLQRVSAMPGTSAAALAENLPLGLGWSRSGIAVEDYTPESGESMEFMNNRVTPGFFTVMGIQPMLGRLFTEADRAGAPPVVVVSEAFARRFWPGESPLGQHIRFGFLDEMREVVGVVPDAKYRSLVEEPQPYFYAVYAQEPRPYAALLVKTSSGANAVSDAVGAALREMGPNLPRPAVMTFDQHMGTAQLPQRIAAGLLSALGFLAIAISGIGLYGLVAFGVAQRSREFGIRMALGAVRGDVRRMVMAGAVRVALIGIACGVPFAVVVAFLVKSLLVVPPLDPFAFVGVPLILAASAVLASWAPARRATRQDPSTALRSE